MAQQAQQLVQEDPSPSNMKKKEDKKKRIIKNKINAHVIESVDAKEKEDKKGSKRHKKNKLQTPVTTILEAENSIYTMDGHELASNDQLESAARARLFFAWLIAPLSVDDFYEHYWEKAPLVIKRKSSEYYNGWFSKEEIDRMLKCHSLEYGTDLNITKYENQTRYTLDPEGIAKASQVWKHFEEGCSIRFLCPQQYCDTLWQMLSILEEEWGCMAGSNTYLTPKNSQGFSPHYDDIEAFLLQVEGKKLWKVYAPLDEAQTLPRFSSKNFSQDEIGEPMFEILLEEGDLLYFPRGYIHQASTTEECHSLHITVSTGQMNTWGDFLQLAVPQAITNIIEENVELRRSLPRDYLDYMGVIHSDKLNQKRETFQTEIKRHLKTILNETMGILDATSDQMAKNLLLDKLPPMLGQNEEICTVEGSPLPKITVNSSIRLLRHGIVRMTVEDGKVVLYHLMDNSRKHHENPISPLEFDIQDAPSIEFILESYPKFIRVGDLPEEDSTEQVELVKALYNEGILMFENDTKQPQVEE